MGDTSEKAGNFIGISTALLAESEPHRTIMEVRHGRSSGSNLFPDSKSFQKAIVNFLNQLHKKKDEKGIEYTIITQFSAF